jgi:hypothetical protein
MFAGYFVQRQALANQQLCVGGTASGFMCRLLVLPKLPVIWM